MNSYDDRHGDLLTRVLRDEAETIRPAGDGLARIRQRVDARHARVRWMRPAFALGMTAVVAGVGAGVYTGLAGDNTLHTNPAGQVTTTGPTPSATTTTPTTPPPRTSVVTTPPGVYVYPFASAQALTSWVEQGGAQSEPWRLDPKQLAIHFVQHLGISVPVSAQFQPTNPAGGIVGLSAKDPNGKPVNFTNVTVLHTGTSHDAPWVVISASDSFTTIDAPKPAAVVSSPLVVRLTSVQGADENYQVSLWSAGGDSAAQVSRPQSIPLGQGTQSAVISYSAQNTGSAGFVAAVDYSQAVENLPSRLVVVPVKMASSSAHTMPAFFVAQQGNRIGLFDSTTGAVLQWLTSAQSGGGASQPQLSPDGKWVYYLQGCGTSCSSLDRVSVSGGQPETVEPGTDNVTAFAVGGDQDQFLAYVATHNGTADVVWSGTSGNSHGFHIQGIPPQVEQLAWSADGKTLAAQVRTGNLWGVMTYDTATASSWSDGHAVPCTAPGSACSAPAYDADGNLYFLRPNSANTVWELVQLKPGSTKLYHVSNIPADGSPEQASVAITPDAYAAVVSTGTGKTYTVVSGKPTLVTKNAEHASW